MPTEVDQRGYLLAPWVPPTAHVLLAPLWSVIAGEQELAVQSFGWSVIAWLGLQGVCLATMAPLLWLLRRVLAYLPQRVFAWAAAAVFSVIASYLLAFPRFAEWSLALSWFAAFVAASFAFAAFTYALRSNAKTRAASA